MAYAAILNSSNGIVSACYSTSSGALRVIDAQSGGKCSTGEKPLRWNSRNLTYRGAWAALITCQPGDVVVLSGSAWVAVIASKGVRPGTDGSWSVLASAGAQGARGDSGLQGPPGPATSYLHLKRGGVTMGSVTQIDGRIAKVLISGVVWDVMLGRFGETDFYLPELDNEVSVPQLFYSSSDCSGQGYERVTSVTRQPFSFSQTAVDQDQYRALYPEHSPVLYAPLSQIYAADDSAAPIDIAAGSIMNYGSLGNTWDPCRVAGVVAIVQGIIPLVPVARRQWPSGTTGAIDVVSTGG